MSRESECSKEKSQSGWTTEVVLPAKRSSFFAPNEPMTAFNQVVFCFISGQRRLCLECKVGCNSFGSSSRDSLQSFSRQQEMSPVAVCQSSLSRRQLPKPHAVGARPSRAIKPPRKAARNVPGRSGWRWPVVGGGGGDHGLSPHRCTCG